MEMDESCKFKIILHSSNFKEIHYLKIFEQKNKIEGKEINFDLAKDKFNQFDISLPSKINLLNSKCEEMIDFTLNLLREKYLSSI